MTTAQEALFAPGPRRSVAIGGSLLLIGLAVVGTGHSDAGAAMSLGGLALLIFGVHSFGRSGEDEPRGELDGDLDGELDDEPPSAPASRRAGARSTRTKS